MLKVSDKKIHVLIEVDSSDIKIGAINDVLDLIRYSGKVNIRYTICGSITSEFENILSNLGAQVINKQSRIISKKNILTYLLDVFNWYLILGRIHPDIVHFNYISWGPSLGFAAFLRKIPMVCRAGGQYIKNNLSSKWISLYLANCEVQANDLLNSILHDRVVVVGDLINFDRIAKNDPPHPPLPEKSKTPRILFLGQLVRRKGIDILIEALAGVDQEYEAFLVGGNWHDRGYPQEIKKMVDDYGIGSKVKFIDHRSDAIAVMKTCDIFVLPSRSEARPRSIIEAMLLGLCVVSTKTGGIPTLVKDGETGLLAEADNTKMLSELLQQVISSQELREKIGKAARLKSVQEFDPKMTAKNYYNVYRSLLEL